MIGLTELTNHRLLPMIETSLVDIDTYTHVFLKVFKENNIRSFDQILCQHLILGGEANLVRCMAILVRWLYKTNKVWSCPNLIPVWHYIESSLELDYRTCWILTPYDKVESIDRNKLVTPLKWGSAYEHLKLIFFFKISYRLPKSIK